MENVFNGLQEFLGTGGNILFYIMILTFFMWTFILERFAYYLFAHKPLKSRLMAEWDARSDKTSWKAAAAGRTGGGPRGAAVVANRGRWSTWRSRRV